jgi:hypothetical protein
MANANSKQNSDDLGDSKINRLGIDINKNQEIIYRFFVGIVTYYPPEDVLIEFKQLFFEDHSLIDAASQFKALSNLILSNDEKEFFNTLKRCCYIIINNWATQRKLIFIKSLVDSFQEVKISRQTLGNYTVNRRQIWLFNFINGQEYQELKLFASQYEATEPELIHWTERYTSYLLTSQYLDTENPKEQQQAAMALAQNLKRKFKFDLAMYTARRECPFYSQETLKNPTCLGNEVLKLIKIILAKKGKFNYVSLANIFIKQTQEINYSDFKKALYDYLVFRLTNPAFWDILNKRLKRKLLAIYSEHDEDRLNNALFLRTCNKVCDYLTSEFGHEPSEIFIHITAQNNPMTHGVLLLKLILISPNSRTHLEKRIADLICFYKDYNEQDCHWIINFLDILNITFALYADQDVQYDVIRIKDNIPKDCSDEEMLQYYRVFSQSRGLSQTMLV